MEERHIQSLIVRYLSKESTPEDESELLDWLAKDPSNQHVFKEWQQIWESHAVHESSFDFSKGLDRLNKAVDNSEVKSTRASWRKLAASITIFLAASLAIYFIADRSSSNTEFITYQQQTTTSGQRTTLSLEDGSMIILNANSSLKYPKEFSIDKREVFLVGEAFFQVSKDAKRPFIIHSGEIDTQVLGTSFNINSNKDFVTVSVATGKVKVMRGDVEEVILPKEKIVYGVQRKKMFKTVANLEHELAWKNNTIIFEDSQLSHVAVKLREFYGVSVVFEAEILKKCLVTGKFINQPIEIILKAISFSTGIRYRVEGKKITLYGPGCE
jgi:ferric-dicitrate binding protein FerR (iron transport regulator)